MRFNKDYIAGIIDGVADDVTGVPMSEFKLRVIAEYCEQQDIDPDSSEATDLLLEINEHLVDAFGKGIICYTEETGAIAARFHAQPEVKQYGYY